MFLRQFCRCTATYVYGVVFVSRRSDFKQSERKTEKKMINQQLPIRFHVLASKRFTHTIHVKVRYIRFINRAFCPSRISSIQTKNLCPIQYTYVYTFNISSTILNRPRGISQTISNLCLYIYIIMCTLYSRSQYSRSWRSASHDILLQTRAVIDGKRWTILIDPLLMCLVLHICNKAVGKHSRRLCRSPHGGLDLLLLFRRITRYIYIYIYIYPAELHTTEILMILYTFIANGILNNASLAVV